MRVRSIAIVVAAALLLGGGTALAAGSFDVYVSNPDLGQIWKVPYDGAAWGAPVLLFEAKKIKVQDVVVGPDDWLYACAPDSRLVFRFDPAAVPAGDPLSNKDAGFEPLYDGSVPGPVAPQCGWFSDRGDLFLTDRLSTTAVWMFKDLVPLHGTSSPMLVPLVAADGSPVPASFFGQGITQAAPGDLLFVDNADKKVWSLGFDPIFRFNQPANPDQLKHPVMLALGPFGSPVGIARTAFDDLYVTDGATLRAFAYDGDTGSFSTKCSYTFSGFTARFLAFTSDDRLFVATTSNNVANLWEMTTDCTPVGDPILTLAKPAVNKPAMSGVAVSRTSRDGALESSSGYYYFNFKDHAYEITLDSASCTDGPTVSAQETPPECLANLINCYLETDENFTDNPVTGVPVTYAGDGGMAQLYSVNGSCEPTGPEPSIGHAISAYTDLVKNPRIIRCTDPFPVDICAPCDPLTTGDEFCQIIKVESFFPFNGVFPDDGRIEGSRPTTDFSEYFFADIELSNDDIFEYTPGCFCGWESPLPNIYLLDTTNPFTGLPVYNSGSSVPLKFRVAATDGSVCGANGFDYCATPDYGYVTGARVLLSVAQIFSGDATLYEETFVVKDPRQTSGEENNEFGNPNNPNTPYHYNLDTSDFAPGIYQAVALAITDNFAVEWTYFAVR